MWDPETYERFAEERARPFTDLLAQVHVPRARRVVDLGCGTGALTAQLAARWPGASVLGVDSSPEMLAAAAGRSIPGRLEFQQQDLRDFAPEEPYDVIVSNAALQWVPGHRSQLTRLAGFLAPGGVLAFQVPNNFDEPSHRLLAEILALPRWRDRVPAAGIAPPGVGSPEEYLATLAGTGLTPTVWETTYVQVLSGEHAVLEWMRGTALRPVLAVLGDGPEADAFLAEYGSALEEAYPPGEHGTVLPYRRIFAVGRAAGGPGGGPA